MKRPARRFMRFDRRLVRSALSACFIGAFTLMFSVSAHARLSDDDGAREQQVTGLDAADPLQDPPRRRPPGGGRPGGEAPPQAAPVAPPPPEKPKSASDDRYLAIRGGRVFTMNGPVLDDVIILAKNGRITDIGPNVRIPDEAEVIDAAGHFIYPGLIAVQTSGIVGAGNQPQDTVDPFALNLTVALAAGITTALTGENAVKLTYGTLDDHLLRGGLFTSFRYSTREPTVRLRIRQNLDRVQQYLRDLRAYERDRAANPALTAPDNRWIRGDFERYLRLMRGETIALVDASGAQEMLEYARLARDYGIKFIIRGGAEAWTIAPEISRAGMDVIVTPRERRDANKRLVRPDGTSIENAAILNRHGVRIAFIPSGGYFGPGTIISFGGLAGRDLAHYAMEAAFSVRGGLSQDAAIRALTIDAARMFRIDDRVGSIEVGKDADFAITDGDLLHYMTHVRWAVVNGRIAYDKSKETLFSHIRPDGDQNPPPPDDYWPRRLGQPW